MTKSVSRKTGHTKVIEAGTFVRTLSKGLDESWPNWRRVVVELAQVPRIEARRNGWRPTDEEVVQALLLAYLSAMTDWSRIQSSRSRILHSVRDWSPAAVSRLTDEEIAELHGWFIGQRLGSLLLKQQLFWLRRSALVFVRMRTDAGSVDRFLERAWKAGTAVAGLSAAESSWKLPGCGVALTSEFLKNLGFDDFKPDRHLIRILGRERLGLAPNSNPWRVREVGIALAHSAGIPAAQLDQMLWLFCARSYAAVCSSRPRCGDCSLNEMCRYPRRRRQRSG